MFLRRAFVVAVVVFELPQWDSLRLWPHYGCKFPDARCRPWLLLSDGFYTCSTMSRGGWGGGGCGKHKGWGNGRILVGWHSVMRKDHPLVGIHICPCLYQEETETRSFHYTNSLIGDIAMVIYKSRPCWPYALSPCRALPWTHVLAVQMVINSRNRRRTEIGAVQGGF